MKIFKMSLHDELRERFIHPQKYHSYFFADYNSHDILFCLGKEDGSRTGCRLLLERINQPDWCTRIISDKQLIYEYIRHGLLIRMEGPFNTCFGVRQYAPSNPF